MASFVTNLNLNTNQLQNAVIQPLAADPSNIEGRIYYSSTSKYIRYFNGTSWVSLGISGATIDLGTGVTGTLMPSHGGTGVANSDTSTITLGGSFATSGGYALTLTLTGTTSVTLPVSGTLSTLAGSESLSNKTISLSTYNGLTITSTTGGLTIANGVTLNVPAAATISGNNSGDVTLLADSGLSFTSGQGGLALGTPTSLSATSTNSVTTNTHSHAVTGFAILAGGSIFTGGVTTFNAGAALTIASGATLTITDAPVNPTDAANKQYVDNVAIGLNDWKQSVRVTTTGNITLVGSAPNVVDGVTLNANDRILVKSQTNAAENGIYYVSTLGTGTNGTWTRSTDANTSAEVSSGLYVYVEEGSSTNKGQYVLNTSNPIILGTTNLTFARFNGGSTLTGGTGVTISGDTVSLTNQITAAGPIGSATTIPVITYNAQGQLTTVSSVSVDVVSVLGFTPTKKYATAVTGVGPSYIFTHGLGSADLTVSVYDDTGNIIYPDVAVTSTQITLTYGIGAPTAVNHRLVAVG